MSNYEPDFVYMIPIEYKQRLMYYEKITHMNALIKGAFIVGESSEDTIDFLIISPNNKIIRTISSNYDIFEFEAKEIGNYKIVFNNKYVNIYLFVYLFYIKFLEK
jgi:hypothetical protein